MYYFFLLLECFTAESITVTIITYKRVVIRERYVEGRRYREIPREKINSFCSVNKDAVCL